MSLQEALLTNAALLTLLAALAWLIGLAVKRPGWMHLIWLLVVLRALSPPLMEWAVLPLDVISPEQPGRSGGWSRPGSLAKALPDLDSVSLGKATSDSPTALSPMSAGEWEFPFSGLLSLCWLAGSLVVLVLTLRRGWRFENLIREGHPAPARIGKLAHQVADRMGIRCPPIQLVDASVSPLLWYRPGRLMLVLPRQLLRELSSEETRLLLAHEMAHFKRKDHWVRIAELAASALFWWHPALHWSRTRLRQKEEECCDLEVVTCFPEKQSVYARTLLRVAEFLSMKPTRSPQLSCGVGLASLQERICRIMTKNLRDTTPSTWHRVAFLAACGWALLLFPVAAQQTQPAESNQEDTATAQALRRLQDEARQLEVELRSIRVKQMDLEAERNKLRHQAELLELQREIERLDAEGQTEKAQWLSRQQDLLRERMHLRQEELQLEQERELAQAELRSEMQSLEQELAAAHRRADEQTASALEMEALSLKSSMADNQRKLAEREIELRHEARKLEAGQLELDAQRLRLEGRGEGAGEMEKEILLMKMRQELELKQERAQLQLRDLHMMTEVLQQALHRSARMRSLGRLEEAKELDEKIRELRKRIEERP